MFNSLMKPYDIYNDTTTTNEWNETIHSYSKQPEQALIYIALLNHNNLTVNNVDVTESTHIGVTINTNIEKGMLIDNKYQVTYVMNTGKDIILTLKEVSGNE